MLSARASPALSGAAELYSTGISAPANGSTVKSGMLSFVDVRGALSVATAAGELPAAAAFPSAQLLLFKCTAAGGAACGDPASFGMASARRGLSRAPPTVLQTLAAPVNPWVDTGSRSLPIASANY